MAEQETAERRPEWALMHALHDTWKPPEPGWWPTKGKDALFAGKEAIQVLAGNFLGTAAARTTRPPARGAPAWRACRRCTSRSAAMSCRPMAATAWPGMATAPAWRSARYFRWQWVPDHRWRLPSPWRHAGRPAGSSAPLWPGVAVFAAAPAVCGVGSSCGMLAAARAEGGAQRTDVAGVETHRIAADTDQREGRGGPPGQERQGGDGGAGG
jgi:hypothetical protein